MINSQSVVLINVIIIIVTGGDEVSPEDLQTIHSLYHTCPQLWDEFGNISCFLGLLRENYQAYKELYLHLARMDIYFDNHLSDGKEDALLVFAVAVGFVERSVQSSRQIMRDMGKAYITELPPFSGVDIGFDMLCLHKLRSLYMTCSARSSRFRLRLAQTGFLEDLMEDIKHIKHLSGDTLVSRLLFGCVLSLWLNWLEKQRSAFISRTLHKFQSCQKQMMRMECGGVGGSLGPLIMFADHV